MQQTEKYNLNIIESTDPFSHEPLNENTRALEDLIRPIEAAYTPDNKPYVAGTYVGTGKDMTFNIGFRPSFLIVNGATVQAGNDPGSLAGFAIFTAGNVLSICVTFTDTGFTLHPYAALPRLTENGKTYDYIAFR